MEREGRERRRREREGELTFSIDETHSKKLILSAPNPSTLFF